MIIIDEILASIKFADNFFIIGIDGPTASGKTTLADALGREFDKREIPFFIYRLDWTLAERSKRLADLNYLMSKNKVFEFEAGLHMDLVKAMNFLSVIEKERYNDTFFEKEMLLSNLYSRENNGMCDGVSKVKLKKNMVIIMEGHYTHHHLLRNFFDRNYLLIARPEELILRKSKRTASYRNNDEVEKYFSLIDLPSFAHYYQQNKSYIDHIFLNETLNEQQSLSHKNLQKILFSNFFLPDTNPAKTLIPACFDNSDSLNKSIDQFFNTLVVLHQKLLQLWGVHPQYRKLSLTQETTRSLKAIGFKFFYSTFYTQKSNVFSYELGAEFNKMYFLVTGNLKSLSVAVASGYTQRLFRTECDANGIISTPDFKMITLGKMNCRKQYAFVPNKFLVPCFIKQNENIGLSYYQIEEKCWDNLKKIFFNPTFIVVRIKSTGQNDFLKEFFRAAGFYVFIIGNYFFAQRLKGRNINNEFNDFYKELPTVSDVYKNKIELNKSEADDLRELGLVWADDQLYFTSNVNIKKLLAYYVEARSFIKNKLTMCLSQTYSEWKLFNKISLGKFIRNLPVPLKDFYFSLSISNLGAVPFISLYHLKNNGVDIQAYFNYFSAGIKPFGIQASMNALGVYKDKGYLDIHGPAELAEIVKKNLISFLDKNPDVELPIWGLGIDHAAENSSENLRVLKFIKEANNSHLITSFCLDTSKLLINGLNDYSHQKTEDFITHIFKILSGKSFDLEYYIGNEDYFSKQSTTEALDILKNLAFSFRKTAESKNQECNFLFGPFLGTQHHQQHNNLDVALSGKVYRVTKPYGFIGNVLHGTSYTPQSHIRETVKQNCIRINYAGKLLKAIISSFPDNLQSKSGQTQEDWKRYLVSEGSAEIKEYYNLIQTGILKVLKDISKATMLPQMGEDEINWFRNNLVCLPDEDFSTVVNNIFSKKHDKISNINHNKPIFLASMIEVPLKEFTGGLVDRIIQAGISDFHIDIGDGNLISRKLDGFEKLSYLNKFHQAVITHIHLMVADPFSEKEDGSYIAKICEIKQSLIYVHPEAFRFVGSWKRGSEIIKQLKGIPGVVLTVDDKTKTDLFLNKMAGAGINHILVMGVPIGRGGQTFRERTLQRIREINSWADKNNYIIAIEIDGGLSDNVIKDCINAGVSYLAGWSMFLKYGIDNIEKRIKELMNG
jgi:ribulose-phosphate 3-epimerase